MSSIHRADLFQGPRIHQIATSLPCFGLSQGENESGTMEAWIKSSCVVWLKVISSETKFKMISRAMVAA